MTGLPELQRNWDDAARRDAMWIILTVPGTEGGRWDPERFFASGEQEIEAVLAHLERRGIEVGRGRALDFGCGIGRLTQALAERFRRCDGVDIAPAMIEQARERNQHGERCRYHVNDAGDLRLFEEGSFDFVYSSIVLQHIEPELAKGYIAEFVRALSPGGVTVFQAPSERRRPGEADGDASRADGPLPDGAFAAEIVAQSEALTVNPGSQLAISARVSNRSDTSWPALGRDDGALRIVLANHWLWASGERLVRDDARAGLPEDLEPGQDTGILLRPTAPPKPGRYLLELDLVQEGVAWFADHGSPTARVPVEVVRPPSRLRRLAGGRRSRGPTDEPWMPACLEMHPLPKEQVLEVLQAAGAEVVSVERDHLAEPDWMGYRYTARRPA